MLEQASLRLRLSGTLGIFFLGGMIALYFAAQSYSKLAADRSYDRLLAGSALSVGETLSVANNEVLVDIPYSALDMLSAAPDDKVFYRISNPEGETVTGYTDLPAPPENWSEDLDNQGAYFFEAPYRGENVRFAYLPRQVVWNGEIRATAVQIGQTSTARQELANELLVRALIPIGLMTLLALAVVWFGIGLALRPLSHLSQDLLRRDPGELGPLSGPAPHEILPLVDALNSFMRRLNANVLALRVFIADAAHQIRTPLASLSAQAQLARGEDGEELQASLSSINRNAFKLTRLVNQLLSDATIQHRSDVQRFEDFDLLATILNVVREVVPQAEDSDVRLKTRLSCAPYYGDPVIIGEAVKNLIHNSLVHGASDTGEIVVELSEEPNVYVISIFDRGPGIPEADHDAVFERFARRNELAPGAGLGLAIVKQAAASHGGNVELCNRNDGGLQVKLTLPKYIK